MDHRGQHGRCTAHGIHRRVLKPGRPFLGKTFRRFSVSRRPNHGNGMADAEAVGTRVDVRRGEVDGKHEEVIGDS